MYDLQGKYGSLEFTKILKPVAGFLNKVRVELGGVFARLAVSSRISGLF